MSGSVPRRRIHSSGVCGTGGVGGPSPYTCRSVAACWIGNTSLPNSRLKSMPKPQVKVSRSRTVMGRFAGTLSSRGPSGRARTLRPASSGRSRSTGSSSRSRHSSTRIIVAPGGGRSRGKPDHSKQEGTFRMFGNSISRPAGRSSVVPGLELGAREPSVITRCWPQPHSVGQPVRRVDLHSWSGHRAFHVGGGIGTGGRKDVNAVCSGDLHDPGRVGRHRLGQYELLSLLPQFSDELLE